MPNVAAPGAQNNLPANLNEHGQQIQNLLDQRKRLQGALAHTEHLLRWQIEEAIDQLCQLHERIESFSGGL